MADTIPGNNSSSQTLAIGSPASSAIDFAGDSDWWRISLATGYSYRVALSGSFSGAGTLRDPLLSIYSAAGALLASNDDIGLFNLDARLYFAPSATGTYFVAASEAGNDALGSYTVSVTRDQLASTASAATAAIDGISTGQLDTQSDTSDWYRITLIAGVQYQFDLVGRTADGAAGGMADPWLALRSGSGALLASDHDSGVDTNARVVFTPTSSGLYFLDAQSGALLSDSGTYRLIVNANPLVGALTLGAARAGALHFEGDVDRYSLTLVAGVTYRFSLQSSGLADPYLELLDSAGVTLALDDDSGAGFDAFLSFTPGTSGTYFALARAAGHNLAGGYSLTATEVPQLNIARAVVTEGNSGSNMLLFTVTLSTPSATAVTFTATTAGGSTATAGIDFTPISATVTVAPGASSSSFGVPIIGDTVFEPTEVFTVTLSNPSGATLGVSTAFGLIADNDSPYTNLPIDSQLALQWHLFDSTGIDVFRAWPSYTGRGVRVAVFDQGIDATNPDLAPNVLTALGRNAADLAPGGAPVLTTDNHGTAVGGVIAGAANGLGIVGVAYGASLVPIYSSLSTLNTLGAESARAFTYARNFDVLNNSWGTGNLFFSGTNYAFYDDFAKAEWQPAAQALKALADLGRGGLGTVVVQAAGNTFGYGDDTNLHNFQNSRYIITVGATNYAGESSHFSTPGASLLVSAPGGESAGANLANLDILTTDRSAAAGYNTTDFVQIAGTSFSSPIVAGVVALMLEANPALGYRDVQEILAYSARLIDDVGNDWRINGAHNWNGGGLHYDAVQHDLGFGLVDAAAAVRLAESWQGAAHTSANVSELSFTQAPRLAIPDNGRATGAGGAVDRIVVSQDMRIERVEVVLNVTHPWVGDLSVTLIAPSGVESVLMGRPGLGNLSPYGSTQDNIHFTFGTVLDWGETTRGTWRLDVLDLGVRDLGTFDSWTIHFIGAPTSADDIYIFTDEYASSVTALPARATLADTGGLDTLNAAACSANVVLDLRSGGISTIAGRTLTLSVNTLIERAIGGDGNDLIVGNAADNVLYGMRGADTLTGGAGNDLFSFVPWRDGSDLITDFSVGDRIQILGARLLGGMLTGDGTGLAKGRVSVFSTGSVSLLKIGLDDAAGADYTLSLTGNFSPAQLRLSGEFVELVAVVNHAPTAGPGSASGTEDTVLVGNLPAATDADGDVITYALAVGPMHGGLLVATTGRFTYTPAPNYFGSDSFTFRVIDSKGAGNNYPVNLSIAAVVDTITGTSGHDTLQGYPDADRLIGLAGNDRLMGLGGDDTIDGGAGIDTAVYASSRAAATLRAVGSSWSVTTQSEGTDTLVGIERLTFGNAFVALDLNGHAGDTAKIIGAIFGTPNLANKGYVGIGLQLLDGGMAFNDLIAEAMTTGLFKQLAGAGNGPVSHTQFVNLVYKNVVGAAPNAVDLAYFVGLLNRGTETQVSLANFAATCEANLLHIDLVGLSQTGIEYVPPPGG